MLQCSHLCENDVAYYYSLSLYIASGSKYITMRAIKYPASLALRLENQQREAVEQLAWQKRITLGEAARELLNAGIEARGLMA